MKVAYLVSDMDHAHNYGLDFLYAGLVAELGFANVIDWPEKDCLHLPSIAERDACNIDSDQCFPRKASTWDDVLACDLAIIANDPHGPDGTFMAARCSRLPRSMPIAAIDASDRVENCAEWYEAVAGRPLAAYFKREYPIGETWVKTYACPLSYPASRVPALEWGAKRGVFYYATDHGGGEPGIPRQLIVDDIFTMLGSTRRTAGTCVLDMRLFPGQDNRPLPEEYHERMARGLIGISWNGASNFDSNRLHENWAYGLAQVTETPRIQFPVMPTNGINAIFADTPADVVRYVWLLAREPERAKNIALAGNGYFREHDCSEARARYVLKTLEAIG